MFVVEIKMLVVPEKVASCFESGVGVREAANISGTPIRQVKQYYRALSFRAEALAERRKEQIRRDREACLANTGVRRALEDSDRAGSCIDYPLDALKRWGLDGVPSCFGVARD